MKVQVFFIMAILMSGTMYAQTLNPQKDVAFGQMAAGGVYETVLVVTNRGTGGYSGVMELYKGTGNQWNPLVNGTAITNGTLAVTLAAGETKSYKLTLPGETESGFAVIRAADLDQTSFIEGNVTYFVRSGGTITESVGVSPSGEFYRATLPADDLSTLLLALVNLNNDSASVTLTIFPENSTTPLGSQTLTLGKNNHSANFLAYSYGLFPNLSLSGVRGRVEIESDKQILGTAMTAINGLFSSLPLLASPYSYNFSTSISEIPLGGQIGVWHEGPYVKGYLCVTTAAGSAMDPPATFLFHGTYTADKTLRAAGVGQLAKLGNIELGVSAEFKEFSLAAASANGSLKLTNMQNGQSETSQVSLTKIR
jgi:hypothetical protein